MRLKRLVIIATLATPSSSFAEILTIGNNAKVLTRSNAPSIGMSQSAVLRKYGQPQKKLRSRGKITKKNPKISSWHYAKSTVYFENSHVIHTVHHY